MKRRNPAFIIQIFLFWYNSTIEERENPLLQDIFHKLRVTNLTQGGLKAMEELAKLEEERGTLGYAAAGGRRGKRDKYGGTDGQREERAGYETVDRRRGEMAANGKAGGLKKGDRSASDAMCAFLILNISSLQLIPVNMIVYRTKYGSTNPSGIILPAIVATCFSTLAGILYIKMRYGRKNGC